MAEVDTITVKDSGEVVREVPTLLSVEDTLNFIFGAVGASPSANTVLARLKAVGDALGALDDASETDPDAASASVSSILRGILETLIAGAVSALTDSQLRATPVDVLLDSTGMGPAAKSASLSFAFATDGGAGSSHRLLSSAATTNATVVKAGAGTLKKIICKVAATSDVFLKFYNKATTPDENDTPVHTIALPASSYVDLDIGGFFGRYFSTGISYRIVGAAADNSTTAVAAGDIIALNLAYD